jgi:16S rRNA processing protein RimM
VRVTVGRIGKPHGIRGEVTVEPRTDEPEVRFAPGNTVLRESGSDLVVSSMHWHSGRLLLKFLGIDDRNAAETLRGSILQVERDLEDTPEDPAEYYDSNLVGCSVITIGGTQVGVVTDVLHLPAQDVLVVSGDEREVLIPFVDHIVPEIDIQTRIITIDPPDGLLDLVNVDSADTESEGTTKPSLD